MNFSVGTLGPIIDYQAPTARGQGAKALRTVANFHFLKRFKAFENEFIFQKYQLTFFLPEKSIFLIKLSKN